jgi:hypothetical protein
MYLQKVDNKQKNVEIFFVSIFKVNDEKKAGSESGSVRYQNVTDPQNWFLDNVYLLFLRLLCQR